MPRTYTWALIYCLCVLLLHGCTFKPPLKIGFTAELTGHNASLGVQGRNGALLAVETINAQGGVRGRPLELLVRDDAGSPERLLAADRELIDAGVIVLSGHMTSWEATAAYPLITETRTILFSPTTSTPDLSGQADLFFRLIPVHDAQSAALAQYAYQTLGLRRVAVLYDADNRAFAETFAEGFARFFGSLGGSAEPRIGFSSTHLNADFADLVAEVRAARSDGLLIVASSFDAALIAQQTRLQDWNIPLLASNWAYTPELLSNGGRAVEGLLLSSHFNQDCSTPAYLDFKRRYEEAYGQGPSFVSLLAYETIQVLAEGLAAADGQADQLREELSRPREFAGLCDRVLLDEYGDVQRNLYLVEVQGGSFVIHQTIEPVP